MLLTNSESQIEKFAAMYKSLQPQEEFLTFVPPNFDLLQEIRNQGEIVISNRNANPSFNGNGAASQAQNIVRRPIVRQNVSGNGSGQWSESSSPENVTQHITASTSIATSTTNTTSSFVTSNKTYASIVKPAASTQIIGQCVPGGSTHVSVKPALSPSNLLF